MAVLEIYLQVVPTIKILYFFITVVRTKPFSYNNRNTSKLTSDHVEQIFSKICVGVSESCHVAYNIIFRN